MTTDLERFRDHCRRMADAGPRDRVRVSQGGGRQDMVMRGPMCDDEQRAEWRRMADEVDAYLEAIPADEPMF